MTRLEADRWRASGTTQATRIFPKADRAGGRRPLARDRRRRVPRPRRPVRLRQVDEPAHARGARGGRLGQRLHRRPRRDAPAAEVARRRDGVPELRALPAHDGRRQHRLRAQARARAAKPRSGAASPRRRRCSTSRSTWSASRRRSRAGSASASRWAARSSAGRRSSCSTSRSRTSTRSCASRRGRRSRRCSGGSGSTTVYVTHDQVEAMTMGDRVAVLDRGKLQQVDTPHRLFTEPANMLRRRLHRLAGDEPPRGAA